MFKKTPTLENENEEEHGDDRMWQESSHTAVASTGKSHLRGFSSMNRQQFLNKLRNGGGAREEDSSSITLPQLPKGDVSYIQLKKYEH